jgi:hypothetical protein
VEFGAIRPRPLAIPRPPTDKQEVEGLRERREELPPYAERKKPWRRHVEILDKKIRKLHQEEDAMGRKYPSHSDAYR